VVIPGTGSGSGICGGFPPTTSPYGLGFIFSWIIIREGERGRGRHLNWKVGFPTENNENYGITVR